MRNIQIVDKSRLTLVKYNWKFRYLPKNLHVQRYAAIALAVPPFSKESAENSPKFESVCVPHIDKNGARYPVRPRTNRLFPRRRRVPSRRRRSNAARTEDHRHVERSECTAFACFFSYLKKTDGRRYRVYTLVCVCFEHSIEGKQRPKWPFPDVNGFRRLLAAPATASGHNRAVRCDPVLPLHRLYSPFGLRKTKRFFACNARIDSVSLPSLRLVICAQFAVS